MGGKPSFEAVDGSGLAVGVKVHTTAATRHHNGDGGFGSIGDVLLQISGQGTFRYAADPELPEPPSATACNPRGQAFRGHPLHPSAYFCPPVPPPLPYVPLCIPLPLLIP